MVNKGYNILDDCFDENKEFLNKSKQQNYEGFQLKYDTDNKQLKKQLIKDTELLIMNNSKN